MKVTFLAHSGFLVELSHVDLLFDYIGGTLPPAGDRPLLVFASHRHADHFSPEIFALADGRRDVRFILGHDIPEQNHPECIYVEGNEMLSPLPGVLVETLPSTDEGVAFLVTAGTQTIFHAGDLNWWHWEGEPDPWNPKMAEDFQSICTALSGRLMDLAMLPLDPRQGVDGYRGAKHFLETASIARFLPMHQWEKFAFTDSFLATYPQFRSVTEKISQNGQIFEF